MPNRPLCVIQSPCATRSGYGVMARDIIRHIIESEKYDVMCVSMPWGDCPMNALDANNPKDKMILDKIVPVPVHLNRQPELFIQISVPNEFQPIGQFNIGCTAGIETTICSAEWVEGCNRMDVIWTISQHSKAVFEATQLELTDRAGQKRNIKVEKPVEVLHNCIDPDVFQTITPDQLEPTVKETIDAIPEKFCFLFVGHWLKGEIGEDRKNVGVLIDTFCDTFKLHNAATRPALILKTSGATLSIMDQEHILQKIKAVRKVHGLHCPSVYLLHGELTDKEMNSLYNHPKVKVHVSFTKGEGAGLPILEATQSRKPVVASGWSGHLDFLTPQHALLVGGELKPVEPGAVWPGVIIKESQWFNIDREIAKKVLGHVFKHYDKFLPGARELAEMNLKRYSYEQIRNDTIALLDKYVPKFVTQVPLTLPKLKKVGAS